MKKLPIIDTLKSSFGILNDHFMGFVKVLALPFILMFVVNLIFAIVLNDPQSPLMFFNSIITLILFAWMVSVASRYAITLTTPDNKWTRRETLMALWLLMISFLVTFAAFVPSLIIGVILSLASPFLGIACGAVLFFILQPYMFARLVLVFPAQAMGDAWSLQKAWDLSKGNGWRLVVLVFVIPMLFALATFPIILLVPSAFVSVPLSLLAIVFALISVIAAARAYKFLAE